MIYLVSKQQSLFNSDKYQTISLEEAFNILNPLKEVQFDTETEGLDCFTKKLFTIQLGNKENQIVFDCTSYNPTEILKEYFESNRIFIGWNLSFDLKWLYKHDIWPQHIYDGMIVEQLIYLGYSAGTIRYGLKDAAKRWLDIDLDKSIRGQIINVGLTPEVIEYAGNDVKYLEDIKDLQMEEIKKQNMEKAVELENSFVRVLAYMEFCGVKLDVNKWKAKMAKDQAKLNQAKEGLNNWVVNYYKEHNGYNNKIKIDGVCDSQWEHNPENISKFYYYVDSRKLTEKELSKGFTKPSNREEFGTLYCIPIEIPFPYIKVDLQGDLFSGFDPEPKCIINWDSPKQIIPLFELLGFKLDTFDKKTKQEKKSVDSKIIKKQKDVCGIAEFYLEYKEASKVCSAFGQNWLDAINPITGRIHPDYHQLGTATARLSSGGGLSGCNVQQIPHEAETRSCFVSEKGNCWISEDFQSQESRLIASVANDSAMIDLFLNGCGDVHSLVAYMSYINDIPRNTKIEEISSKYKSYRQSAKGIEFAINYGGDFNTLSKNGGIPIDEAKELYDNYMKGFPGVAKYQEYCRKAVIKDGFILMNPLTGHRAHIEDWEDLQEIRDLMNQEGFWEDYRYMKKYEPYNPLLSRVRSYFKRKAELEKASINYRIQNRGSMTTKIAGILFFNWIIKNNYQNLVKICVQVHDEYNCEAPKDIAEEVALILQKCMEKGGSIFCTKIPLGSDISRLEDNSLPDFWIH